MPFPEKILNNNAFCTVLIVGINALFISSIILMAEVMGGAKVKVIYWVLYSVLLLGNVVIRIIMKEGSEKLARNYFIVIIGLLLLFLPLSRIIT